MDYLFLPIITVLSLPICACLPLTLTEHSEHNIEDLFTNFTQMQKKLNDLQAQVQLLQAKNTTVGAIKADGPLDVYFTAGLTSDLKGLVKGETVIYGNDFSNSGGGYNENTGIFTAPVSGVYTFALFCSPLKAADIDLLLKRDGTIKGNCEAEPSFDGENENAGVVYFDRLDVGDKMWVEVYYTSTGTVDLFQNLNTFAGVLIHR